VLNRTLAGAADRRTCPGNSGVGSTSMVNVSTIRPAVTTGPISGSEKI
jgi:hypothetical protein